MHVGVCNVCYVCECGCCFSVSKSKYHKCNRRQQRNPKMWYSFIASAIAAQSRIQKYTNASNSYSVIRWFSLPFYLPISFLHVCMRLLASRPFIRSPVTYTQHFDNCLCVKHWGNRSNFWLIKIRQNIPSGNFVYIHMCAMHTFNTLSLRSN